jgi:catechol 2,3-dioxygenase-like lactoylglutathione lyase family enzyme
VKAHLIVYVADQERSAAFYRHVLDRAPSLHVAGMTEFELGGDAVLGLMPESGIRRLLAPALDAAPAVGGELRAELYLVVDDPAAYHSRALAAGGEELSPLLPRDWGQTVAYSRDPDGYILAFASDP